MKRSEIQIGEAYLVQRGMYGARRRAVVLELDVSRVIGSGYQRTTKHDGIRVRIEHATDGERRATPREEIVTSREIACTWAEHEAQQAARRSAEADADARRQDRVARLRNTVARIDAAAGTNLAQWASGGGDSAQLSLEDLERIAAVLPGVPSTQEDPQ